MRVSTMLLMSLPLLGASSASAQELPSAPDFDPDRAMLNDSPMFDPFRVTDMEPLADALSEGKVRNDTPVLSVERGGTQLALLTMQMSYHHVAQGELKGEPWMVSF